MRYHIEILKRKDKYLLEELAKDVELDESLDWRCNFIVVKNGVKLLGAAGINFDRGQYPQFEHIIIRKEYQHTKLLIVLMKKMERYIKDSGHNLYVSYILNTRNPMQLYAQHWGMKVYASDPSGVWFCKLLYNKKDKIDLINKNREEKNVSIV